MPNKMGAVTRIEVEGTLPIGVGEGDTKGIIMEARITTIMATKIPMVARIITMEEEVVVGAGAVEATAEVATMEMGTLQSSGEVARSNKSQRLRHHLLISHLKPPLKSNKQLP